MAKTDLTNVLVWVSRFHVQALKCMGHLGELQFSFPFLSLPLDYYDVQDLKILLGITSCEIFVASSQHYGLKYIFCRMLGHIFRILNQ